METKDIRFVNPSINQQLIEKFPDLQKDHHESDLYIEYTPEVWEYLKENYEFFKNCSTFFSTEDQKRWIDIPFAFDQFWNKKLNIK